MSPPRCFIERLAAFSRLLMFDKRGTGSSDQVAPATPAHHVDDLSDSSRRCATSHTTLLPTSMPKESYTMTPAPPVQRIRS